MWPWSLIRGLRTDNKKLGESLVASESTVGHLRLAVASWQERTETKSRALEKAQSKIEALEAVQREKDRQLELQRHDYEVMRSDYTAVVSILGNHAQRPRGHTLFEDDPFKEDNSKPDDFVSPPEGEPVDGEAVMTALETQGGQGTE